jgi:predicted DNA-binding transcriptional regulator AlpA
MFDLYSMSADPNPSEIVRIAEVLELTGLRRTMLYDLIGKGRFPAQINLGARAVGWYKREVLEWICSRSAAKHVSDSAGSNGGKTSAILGTTSEMSKTAAHETDLQKKQPARNKTAQRLRNEVGDMRPATIARRMAAIADRSKRAGYGTEALRSFAVQEIWKGIRRTLGVAAAVKSPLTASAIREMVRACPDTLLGSRDRVLLLVGYAGGFRRSELAAIELRHLTFEPDSVSIPDSVNIYVPRSKTDQEPQQ